MAETFDLAVVGAGIVGLAHALAAARHDKRVIVFDRHAEAVGASVRNFGFVTVTGQQSGACWRRAMRSRRVWEEVAGAAGITVEQRGLVVIARRPEAMAVLEAFAATEMGAECRLLTTADVGQRLPTLTDRRPAGGLNSPHELRIESRTAVPRLAAWLAERHGVTFVRPAQVHGVDPPAVVTTAGTFRAEACVVCPGDDFLTLFSDRIAGYGLETCTLQMMRTAPPVGVRLPAPLMSDLSLVRYRGYADLPQAAALAARLAAEQPDALRHGVHLIVVGNGDGSLVVGDSHHNGPVPDVFLRQDIEHIILDELEAVTGLPPSSVIERWFGTYATASDRLSLVDRPSPTIRVVIVSSGTGASTAFAIAEEVVGDLLGTAVPTT